MNKLTISEETSSNVPALYEQNGGGLAVSLARAEVDQQITTARAYPRSISRAVEHILTLATLDEETAKECVYAVPRGGKLIKGPSIRLAEIVAGQWGNCRVGARVVHVDRFEKFVEAEGVFHDLQTNRAETARTRKRIVDSKGRLYNEDMIIMTGNAACAIAKRNAIFAAIPRGVWRKAYEAVESVISGDVKTLVARRRAVFATLAAEYGITADRIFAALEIGGEEDIDLEKLSMLTAMRSSLKNGEAAVEELFPTSRMKDTAPTGLKEKLDALASDPPHDPDTGEIISDEMAKRAQEAAAEANSDVNPVQDAEPGTSRPPGRTGGANPPTGATIDLGTQRLLDDARAKTLEGVIKFSQWHRRLHQKQADQLAPYLDQLRAEANAADGGKESA